MNVDMQPNVQPNDNRIINDAELDLVQGGANPVIDLAKFLLRTLSDAMRMGSGRPQA